MSEQAAARSESGRTPTRTPDMMDLSGVVSAREAAMTLGLSERTVRRAIQRGELAATKSGSRYHIAVEEIERYRLEGNRPRRAARPALTLLTRAEESPRPIAFPTLERSRIGIIPTSLTRFVGREREISALTGLLKRDDVRLVTLTGPGGVGKTRLALRVAAELARAFADGAAFVPLASIRTPDLVPATVTLSLGVREGEDRPPLERLLAFLRDREALLLLDNFEQVTDAGLFLVDLLLGAPRLKLLVTSRTPLHLSGERLFAVPPLALPGVEEKAGDGSATHHPSPIAHHPITGEDVPGAIARSEAVQLFVDRAEAAAADFALTPANAAAVVAICERTNGLPLAIELAAARTALLSPAALLSRLERQLPLLTGGPRDQPARLRTMRDAIAWSYDLLSPDEQALFRRLAVFVGGFALEAAEQVGGAKRSPSVLDLMQRLIDQAVVRRLVDEQRETRFGMLETIREYGLEQLAASGEESGVRDAHADWCIALAERAEPELAGPRQEAWVRRLETELGNIRAAHEWLADQGEAERSLRLAGAIGWLWSSAPYFDEARARFDAILAMPGVERAPAALAKVLWSAGDVADWQGDQRRARAHYERALAIYRELGDTWHAAGMLRGLGSSAIDRGELDLAVTLLEESLMLAREVQNEWEAAAATNLLGTTLSMRGDLTGAVSRHEAAAEIWRRLGDTGHVTTALASGAWVALRAREWHRAATAYSEVLALASTGNDTWYVAWSVIGAGGLAAGQGSQQLAVELLAAGTAERERIGAPLRPQVQEVLDGLIATARRRLGGAVFASAWASGRTLPIETAAARAEDVFAAIEPAIDQEATTAYGLTRRERDVLRLLVDGQSDRQIADALFVTRRSASKYVSALLGKLGVASRTAAATVALRDSLV